MKGDDSDQEECTEKFRRIRHKRLSELSQAKKTTGEVEENERAMDKLAREFQDIFGGVGRYKGPEIKIQIRENIRLVIQPRRRITSSLCQATGRQSYWRRMLLRGHWLRKRKGLGSPTW